MQKTWFYHRVIMSNHITKTMKQPLWQLSPTEGWKSVFESVVSLHCTNDKEPLKFDSWFFTWFILFPVNEYCWHFDLFCNLRWIPTYQRLNALRNKSSVNTLTGEVSKTDAQLPQLLIRCNYTRLSAEQWFICWITAYVLARLQTTVASSPKGIIIIIVITSSSSSSDSSSSSSSIYIY